jgi:hypothetical protein
MRSLLNIWIARLLLVIAYSIGILYTLSWLWILLLGPALVDDKPRDFISPPFTVSVANTLWLYLVIWSGVVFVQVLLRWRTAPHPRRWIAGWMALGLSQWVGFWALVGLLQITQDGRLVLISAGILLVLAVWLDLTRVLAKIDTLGARAWMVIHIGTALSLSLLAMQPD